MTIQNELKKIDEMIEARDKATKVFHSNMKHMTDYLCGKDEGGDFVIADFNRGMPNWKNDIEFCLLAANNIKQLLENYKDALKVIEFYADKSSWMTNSGKIGITDIWVNDYDDVCIGGKRARKFIEGLG